jgi:hypothetical protein
MQIQDIKTFPVSLPLDVPAQDATALIKRLQSGSIEKP